MNKTMDLIRILFDTNADLSARDNAAMDLSQHHKAIAYNALFLFCMLPSHKADWLLFASAGKSLGKLANIRSTKLPHPFYHHEFEPALYIDMEKHALRAFIAILNESLIKKLETYLKKAVSHISESQKPETVSHIEDILSLITSRKDSNDI